MSQTVIRKRSSNPTKSRTAPAQPETTQSPDPLETAAARARSRHLAAHPDDVRGADRVARMARINERRRQDRERQAAVTLNAEALASAVDARLASQFPRYRRPAPRPVRRRHPAGLEHLGTIGNCFDLRARMNMTTPAPRTVCRILTDNGLEPHPNRTRLCIMCGTDRKEKGYNLGPKHNFKGYDVCSECYKLGLWDAEKKLLNENPALEESDLSGLTPFAGGLYRYYGARAERDVTQFRLTPGIQADRIAATVAAVIETRRSVKTQVEVNNRIVTLPVTSEAKIVKADEAVVRESRAKVPDTMVPAAIDLAALLPVFTRTDAEIDTRQGMHSDGDYDGSFTDSLDDPGFVAAVRQITSGPNRRTGIAAGGTGTAAKRRAPLVTLGVDRVANLHELDTSTPYLRNEAIDTDEHTAALSELARFDSDQELRKATKVGLRRSRAPWATTDAAALRWDAEIDQLLRTGKAGPLLADAGYGQAESHAEWAAEHKGTELPAIAKEPTFARIRRAESVQSELHAEQRTWGFAMAVEGATVWTDTHETRAEAAARETQERRVEMDALRAEIQARNVEGNPGRVQAYRLMHRLLKQTDGNPALALKLLREERKRGGRSHQVNAPATTVITQEERMEAAGLTPLPF